MVNQLFHSCNHFGARVGNKSSAERVKSGRFFLSGKTVAKFRKKEIIRTEFLVLFLLIRARPLNKKIVTFFRAPVIHVKSPPTWNLLFPPG